LLISILLKIIKKKIIGNNLIKKLSNINYQIQEKHDYENMDSITSWDRQKNTEHEEPDEENQVQIHPTAKYILTHKKYYSY